MNIDTREWCTASEAGRLLSVTPQRIMQMADDGALEIIRPWRHIALIGRRSIAERLAGARQIKIGPAYARRWLLKRMELTALLDAQIPDIQDRLLEFITEARPRWEKSRQDLWALEMADTLWRSATRVA